MEWDSTVYAHNASDVVYERITLMRTLSPCYRKSDRVNLFFELVVLINVIVACVCLLTD